MTFLLFLFLTSTAQTQEELPPFNPSTFSQKLKGLPQKRLVKILDSLSLLYAARNPEEGIVFLDFAIRQLELKNVDRKIHANFYLRRGQKYSAVKKYALALNDLLRAEELYLKHNDLSGMQQVFTSYANLYIRSGQHSKAVRYALRAKEYAEKLKEEESIGVIYNTLANIYKDMQMTDSAMHYYRMSLQLLREKDYRQYALLLDNISMVWGSLNRNDSAAYYNKAALDIASQKKDTYLELQLLLNNSAILEKRGDFSEQYRSALKAKRLADSMQVYPYQVYTGLNVGAALMNLHQPAKAIEYYRQNVTGLLLFGDYSAVALAYEEMSKGFEKLRMPDSALHYYKLARAQADSAEKTQARDKVNELLAREQMQVQEQKISYLNKLNKTSEEKNAALREKDSLKSAIIWISVCLLVVIAVLLIITFKRFRDNKKLTVLLEHKNTEITDSINYAQRIQFALLPDEKEIGKVLPASFILFQPKDIVSGDFYWVTQKDNLVFVAVGDCTGHGVPGGFMSMLGHSFLNEIIIDKHVHAPGKVLDLLREKVIRALKQTGAAGENKDGMDISLAVIDKANGVLTYAAANNSLYLVNNGRLNELEPDKQPIGFYSQEMRPFSTRNIQYTAGDMLYLFTDGYADQFGGPKGKKLLYKRMKEQLAAVSSLPPVVQQEQLQRHFSEWKGTYEQVDDVCIAGIRLG